MTSGHGAELFIQKYYRFALAIGDVGETVVVDCKNTVVDRNFPNTMVKTQNAPPNRQLSWRMKCQ